MRRLALLTAALLAAPLSAHAQIVANGSFESPMPGTNGYVYNPTGATWTFAGSSGLVIGSPTAFNTPSTAPDGNQVAFLQYNADPASRISQAITLSSSGTYRLTFFDAGRNNAQYTGNTIFDVLLGDAVLATETTTTGQNYALQTVDFSAAAGTYDLAFAFNAAQPSGDNTAFLDRVDVAPLATTATPEPATWALVGAGLLSLTGVARRRRTATV